MPVFDAHAHLRLDAPSLAALLDAMADAGIDKTVVVGGGVIPVDDLSRRLTGTNDAPLSSDAVFDNAALSDLCARSEGKVIPFFFANPQKDQCTYRKRGTAFRGLKLAPAIHGARFDSVEVAALLDTANSLAHPVYTHCLPRPGYTPEDLARVAKSRPGTRFIMGHAGTHVLDLEAIEAVRATNNIHYETSGGYRFTIETAVDRLGADRVVFGSEYPLQDAAVELTKIQRLRVSAAAKDKILFENTRQLVEGL